MPELQEDVLKNELRGGVLRPVYLLYGPESCMTAFYAERIFSAAGADGPAEFNSASYEKIDAEALFAACEQLPVLAPRRVVQVCEPDVSALSEHDFDILLRLVSEPFDTCVLIFRYLRTEPPVKKAGKWKKFYTALCEKGAAVRLDARTEDELVKILVKSAGKQGGTLSAAAARYLITQCGTDLNRLRCECEKLFAYCGKRQVSENDIDLLCPKTLSASAFQMTNAILHRESDRAFALLRELFEMRVEPVMIAGALSSSFVNLYLICAAERSSMTARALGEQTWVKRPDLLGKSASAARRLGRQGAAAALSLLMKCDEGLKATGTDPQILLEQTVGALLCAGQHE